MCFLLFPPSKNIWQKLGCPQVHNTLFQGRNAGRHGKGTLRLQTSAGECWPLSCLLRTVRQNYLCLLAVRVFKPSIGITDFMSMIILYLQKTKWGRVISAQAQLKKHMYSIRDREMERARKQYWLSGNMSAQCTTWTQMPSPLKTLETKPLHVVRAWHGGSLWNS